MKPELVTKRYIPCPQCGEKYTFSIEHLMGETRTFGPWYCDGCGRAIQGAIAGDVVDIEVLDASKGKDNTLVLLQCIHDPKLFLVTHGMRFANRTEAEHIDGSRHFYEEHTCPGNYFRSAVDVVYDGDRDPHGLFRYVTEMTLPRQVHLQSQEETDLAQALLDTVVPTEE